MTSKRRLAFATVAATVCGLFAHPGLAADAEIRRNAPQENWVTLAGCRLEPSDYNDGDSFHVTQGGKRFLFRLCFVDTPETAVHRELKQRINDQAKYWGVGKRVLYRIADEATAFTTEKLSRPFTVYTRWDDARGASQMPRYFAVVRTADGEDLAAALVSAGLARIYGFAPPRLPDGKSPDAMWKHLEELEATAKKQKVGAWADSSVKAGDSTATKPQSTPSRASPTPAPGRRLDEIPIW